MCQKRCCFVGAAITVEEEILYVAPPRSLLYHMEGKMKVTKGYKLRVSTFSTGFSIGVV